MSAGMGSELDLMGTHESIHRRSIDPTAEATAEEVSATDTEMEDVIRNSGLDRKSKKVLHKGLKAWEGQMAQKLHVEAAGEAAKPSSREEIKRKK